MKTFRQLMNEMMTSTSGGVAGMHQSVEPLDGLPQVAGREADRVAVKKKRTVKRESFAGCPVFTVSSDEYAKCMHGRMRYERWNKKLNMEDLNNQEIQAYSYSNPGKSIIIKDETYGTMSYFIPRRNTNESTDKKHKPHGIKSDPAYKKAKTKEEIKKARDQWNLRNPMDLWVGESVTEDYVLKGKKAEQAIDHWLKITGIDKARTRPKLTAQEADKMFGMSTDEKEKYYAEKEKDKTGIRDPRLQNKKTPPRQFFFPKSTKMTAKDVDNSKTEAVGDVFAPSGNEPAGGWTINQNFKSRNIMKKRLSKTKRGKALWDKYAKRPQTPGGDTKSTVMSGKLKGGAKKSVRSKLIPPKPPEGPIYDW